jgi:hypothetical protein
MKRLIQARVWFGAKLEQLSLTIGSWVSTSQAQISWLWLVVWGLSLRTPGCCSIESRRPNTRTNAWWRKRNCYILDGTLLPLLQFPSQGLFTHARRLLMDKNTLISTTYLGYIPTRLGLARLSGDVARPGWHRSPSCHMVPHRVAFLPTRRAPTYRYCRHPVSRRTPLRAKLAKQSSVNCSPRWMA